MMKRRNQKETPTPKAEVGKPKLTGTYTQKTPQAERAAIPHLAATQLPELNKNYENVYKVQTAQNLTPKYKTNRTTTEVSPWNDQF